MWKAWILLADGAVVYSLKRREYTETEAAVGHIDELTGELRRLLVTGSRAV